MRKLAFISLALLLFAACDKPSQEPARKRATLTFEDTSFSGGDSESNNSISSNWWTKYIDSPQYGGSLLYGGNGYAWYDNATTLTSYLPDYWGDKTFFGGGIAVSNYVENPATVTFEHQLTIGSRPVSGGNFAVCYVATNLCPPFLEFKYGTGVIESLYVIPTVYTNAVVQKGNDFSPAMPQNGFMRIEAKGISESGETTGVAVMYLYDGRTFSGWRKWDISMLGVVKRVEFTIYEGVKEDGLYIDSTAEYPTYPSYFAIDDITVLK